MINFLFALMVIYVSFPIMIICGIWSLLIRRAEPMTLWYKIVDDVFDILKNEYER